MKKSILIVTFMFFLLISLVAAEDYCYSYEDCSYWATLKDVNFVEGQNANVTILFPNGTVFVNDQVMEYIGNGTFKYNVTHNVTGNYLARTTFYNSSGIIAVSSQSLSVLDNEILTRGIMISIILGLMGMAGLMLYASNQTHIENKIVLSRALEKIVLYIGGLGFIAVSYSFMLTFVRNEPRFNYLINPLQTFFVVFAIILFAIAMNYGWHVVQELTFNRLENKKRKESGEDEDY